MNHPYTCAASYIYVNESDSALNTHQRQYTPIDPRTKDPYGKQQSFVPSPSIWASTSTSRRSHDSGYSTDRTYTPARRSHHGDNSAGPPPRRALIQSAPRIPPRAPISNLLQQNPPPPPPSCGSRLPRNRFRFRFPISTPAAARHSAQPRYRYTAACVPAPAPFPQNKYDDALPLADEGHPPASPLDVHTRLTPPMKMTPYERDGNPLSQRRSAFIPYNHGPPERKLRDSSGSIRCIRRALKQLKRLMSFKSLIRRGFEHA
ncbi:hypothetical protein B0H13DRAFT_1917225 [Mycena leptocephala]|nr:hypothetical protein B0H13DRAFT_1917225 [Mycena leptocephala]